jgi:glycosyltransferase involved in cell wall biosynthesis
MLVYKSIDSSEKMDFSLCFPTFNRKESITRRVQELNESLPLLPVLVSDNNSTDGTLASINSLNANNLITIINPFEPTFGSNVSNLIRNCQAEWAVFCSDEDNVKPEAISQVKALISNLSDSCDLIIAKTTYDPVTAPKWWSPIEDLGDGIPGFVNIWDYSYLSGVVFKPASFVGAVDLIEKCKQGDKHLKYFYDTFATLSFIWLAHARNRLYTTSTELIQRIESQPPNFAVKDDSRRLISSFRTMEGTWMNYLGAAKFLDLIEPICSSYEGWECRIAAMRAYHQSTLMYSLRLSVLAEEDVLFDSPLRGSMEKILNDSIIKESERLRVFGGA